MKHDFSGTQSFGLKRSQSLFRVLHANISSQEEVRILRGGRGNEIICFFSEAFFGQGKGSRLFCNIVGHLVIPIPLPCKYQVSLDSLANSRWMDGFIIGYWCCPTLRNVQRPKLSLRRLNHCGQAGYSKEQRSKRRRHAPNVDKVDHPSYWSIKSFGGRGRDVILQGN